MPNLTTAAAAAVACFVLAACGVAPPLTRAPGATRGSADVAGIPGDVVAVLAFDGGAALVRPGPSSDAPFRVQRARGAGDELFADGPSFSVRELLDVDDAGNLYVLPAAAAGGDLSSTIAEGDARVVVRVAPSLSLTPLLPESRGIWGFGVAPSGDALWSHGCSPTGIFAVTATGVGDPVMPSPATLWQQQPAALTDAQTFWSVAASGGALVRTTPAGSEDRGTTVMDVGDGAEQGALSRCGGGLCLRFASAVVLLDADGAQRDLITWGDVDGWRGERIVGASGNQDGVYVSLRAGDDPDAPVRVVFVPGS